MAIKPLEKKLIKRLIPKLIFLGTLLVGGLLINAYFSTRIQKTIAKQSNESVLGMTKKEIKPYEAVSALVKNAEDSTVQVLGAATQIVSTTASKSAEIVSNFVFDNTIGKIIDQVKKLPTVDQEKIKQEICK